MILPFQQTENIWVDKPGALLRPHVFEYKTEDMGLEVT